MTRNGGEKSPKSDYYVNFPIGDPIRIFSELVQSLLGKIVLSKLITEIPFPGNLFKLQKKNFFRDF